MEDPSAETLAELAQMTILRIPEDFAPGHLQSGASTSRPTMSTSLSSEGNHYNGFRKSVPAGKAPVLRLSAGTDCKRGRRGPNTLQFASQKENREVIRSVSMTPCCRIQIVFRKGLS
jgi:hypothetical protein